MRGHDLALKLIIIADRATNKNRTAHTRLRRLPGARHSISRVVPLHASAVRTDDVDDVGARPPVLVSYCAIVYNNFDRFRILCLLSVPHDRQHLSTQHKRLFQYLFASTKITSAAFSVQELSLYIATSKVDIFVKRKAV